MGILVRPDDGGPDVWYGIHKFVRSNQGTCLSQRITVRSGAARRGAAPCSPTAPPPIDGELALGRNVLVAFMPWEGYNFEDAILISESVVREDKYTSIHIEEFEIEARDTKLGPEEITRDLPNIAEESPEEPQRARHHLHRRRGPAGRHPGGQDHPQGRVRALRRGAPAARHLR